MKHVLTEQLPAYLKSLPIPNSLEASVTAFFLSSYFIHTFRSNHFIYFDAFLGHVDDEKPSAHSKMQTNHLPPIF